MHSLDTAETIKYLAFEWLPESVFELLAKACGTKDNLISLLTFCGAVHDIGKLTPLFQSRISAFSHFSHISKFTTIPNVQKFTQANHTSHALAGEAILLQYGCPPGIASIIGAHHGVPISDDAEQNICDYPENYFASDESFWSNAYQRWIDFSLDISGFESIDDIPTIPVSYQLLISGLLIMADWIASNTSYFPLIPTDSYGSLSDYPKRAELAWHNAALSAPWHSMASFGINDDDFFERFGFYPNITQREILDTVTESTSPGIYIMEAPMGIGKTEAALASSEILAAHFGSGGIFFGMPTQSTSNGIFPRLEKWASSLSDDEQALHSIRLAHSAAELNDDYRELFTGCTELDTDNEKSLIVHEWFSGRKQVMLSEFVIGTIDQLLLSALKRKHVMLRHIGLAGKVVIIDECHAYDAYMSQYLDMILRWLGEYEVPVIILSATLPAKRRVELISAYLNTAHIQAIEPENSLDYPILTFTDKKTVHQKALSFDSSEKNVDLIKITQNEIVSHIHKVIDCGGCAGIIVNTVKKAQSLAKELHEEFPNNEVLLFHAQFTTTDRADKEKQILQRVGKASTADSRRGLIIIGTQVLEQSLDIDFDLMISELCPMDLLLQRLGRLQRHIRTRPRQLQNAVCLVLDEPDGSFDEGSRAVYGDWLLMRTRALIPSKLTLPNDIPKLVQSAYDFDDMSMFEKTDEEIKKAREEYKREISKKESRAKNYVINEPLEFCEDLPFLNTLDGWLDNSVIINDSHAERAVRDSDSSIDVIAVKRASSDTFQLVSGRDEITIPTDRPPSQEESLKIARQKLRLPGYFSKAWNIDKTITRLEADTQKFFPEWQYSSLLKDELALIFDENLDMRFDDICLHYDIDIGLTFEKTDRKYALRIYL